MGSACHVSDACRWLCDGGKWLKRLYVDQRAFCSAQPADFGWRTWPRTAWLRAVRHNAAPATPPNISITPGAFIRPGASPQTRPPRQISPGKPGYLMIPNNLETAGAGLVCVERERERERPREGASFIRFAWWKWRSISALKTTVVLICSCSAAALFYHVPVFGMRPCWPCLGVMHRKCVDLRCV